MVCKENKEIILTLFEVVATILMGLSVFLFITWIAGTVSPYSCGGIDNYCEPEKLIWYNIIGITSCIIGIFIYIIKLFCENEMLENIWN